MESRADLIILLIAVGDMSSFVRVMLHTEIAGAQVSLFWFSLIRVGMKGNLQNKINMPFLIAAEAAACLLPY